MDQATTIGILQLLAQASDAEALELAAVLMQPYTTLPTVVWLAWAPRYPRVLNEGGEALRALHERTLALPAPLRQAMLLLAHVPGTPWTPTMNHWWKDLDRDWMRDSAQALLTYQAEYDELMAHSPYHTQVYEHLTAGLDYVLGITTLNGYWERQASFAWAEGYFYQAQWFQRRGEVAFAKTAYARYLAERPAHFPGPTRWDKASSGNSWFCPPSTSDAYAGLAALHAQEGDPLEAERLYLKAIGLAPDYYRAPYWALAELLDQRRGGPSAYSTKLRQQHLHTNRINYNHAKLFVLADATLYRRAFLVAEYTWLYQQDAQAAEQWYVLAHQYIHVYRNRHQKDKRRRTFFYQLLGYQLYDIILTVIRKEQKRVKRIEALFTKADNMEAHYQQANRSLVYFAAKALERKTQRVIHEQKDYWQAQRLVKEWLTLQPFSRLAKAYEQQIRDAIPYLS